ncbi:Emopamil-binding protein [Saccharata proteae CBS 121410]|uniref:Emopamil-binding protein n=1 Tax=Saccharata proteae CBS 121410 TaxID=1314787 RepID=A0A9P4LWL9_9PEZI|nr:Emopamil-binding protein [Saccharata proteae CBS 121410]
MANGSPPSSAPAGPTIDATTIISLLSTVAVLGAAYALSVRLLPRSTGTKARVLFIWHVFDALIHFCFEGSFLWNCFFVSAAFPLSSSSSSSSSSSAGSASPFSGPGLVLTPPDVFFLGHEQRVYGASYGSGPFSRLWQEYAKADRRWGGTDLTVVSLELLTVFVGGPLACWCAEMVRRGEWSGGKQGMEGRKWFWMCVLAVGELYGGFMTFAPEWLSGSPNLDTSNWMYLWVYLVFFNTLWVWFPLWILYEAYNGITTALSQKEVVNVINYLEKGKKSE